MYSSTDVQTPSIHDFNGFAIKILQYEIKTLPKSYNKGRRTHFFTTNFYGTDVMYKILATFIYKHTKQWLQMNQSGHRS